MTFPDEVEADDPTIWWDTRQASGTVQPDRSGNGNTGTISGSPFASDDGLTFDASAEADCIVGDDAAFAFAGAEWTIEAVMRVDANGYANVCGFGSAEMSPTEYLFLEAGIDDFRVYYSSGGSDAETPQVLGELVHLLGRADGTDVFLYLNGTQVASDTADDPTLAIEDAFLAGFYTPPDSAWFDGLIRHAIFYDHDIGNTRAVAHAAAFTDDPNAGVLGNIFRPPTANETPPVVAEDWARRVNKLYRYFSNRAMGRNVWRLNGGTYTFDQPTVLNAHETLEQTYERVFYGGHAHTISDQEAEDLAAFLTAEGYEPTDWITQS